MRQIYILNIILLLFIPCHFLAQDLHYELSEDEGKMFSLGNYQRAKELYQKLYKKDLSNLKYKYRYGISLIYSYEKKKGLKLLEEVSKEATPPKDIDFYLGKAYHLNNRYDLAIKKYETYLKTSGAKDDLIRLSEQNIAACFNAKELIKNRINVSFENLGRRVNSKGNDYSPYVTPNEDFLFFTTRREGTTGRVYDFEDYYTADIYLSKYKYRKWYKASSVGFPNSYGNEQVAGISENGQYIIYHVDNPKSKNNLQISKKSRSSYKKSVKIESKQINNGENDQSSAAISDDLSYIIFSSDRTDGLGGKDLYVIRKLPDGKWGEPFNLGESVNTPLDECNPYITDNGTTLYFASEGHNSMGGFDIFKSKFDQVNKKWLPATNIGYPINSADDNMNISFSKNKKYAYISAHRKDSYGNLDIYRVNFENIDPQYSVIKGHILDLDSNLFNSEMDITVCEKETEEVFGIYRVSSEKSKYIMILPPNEYEVIMDIPDKGSISQPLIVEGRGKYRKEINRNIKVVLSEEQVTD